MGKLQGASISKVRKYGKPSGEVETLLRAAVLAKSSNRRIRKMESRSKEQVHLKKY